MKTIITAIFLAQVSLTAWCQSTETGIKDLLLEALRSPSGSASADVVGPIADVIRRQINTPNARIHADVTTLMALSQDGCKRMSVRFSVPGVMLPTNTGALKEFFTTTTLNLCANGQPPGVVSAK